MPLYGFECKACGRAFETLVRSSDGPYPDRSKLMAQPPLWKVLAGAPPGSLNGSRHWREGKRLMRIIGLFSIVFSITFMSIYQPAQSAQRAQATAKEVVAKVREAVALLSSEGEKGLAAFRKQKPPFVWKDSYVFIADCDRGIILANPLQPAREGKPIAAGPTYAGVTAAERAAAQCKAAFRPGGGWYAYSFAKPGTPDIVRKVSYLLKVPGSGWIAGAGVYDAKTPIEDFEKITESESKR